MLKAEYIRKINKSSFILTPEKDCREERDSIEMFRYHKIPYFLRMQEQKTDTKLQFCYDITGKRSLGQLLEYKTLDYPLFQKIITSFDQACLQTENYMLTENDILLNPEFVFAKSDTEQIVYCYLPGNREDICGQFKAFMEYLLKFLEHKDERAVQLAYGIYQRVIEKHESLHNVLGKKEQLLAEHPYTEHLNAKQNIESNRYLHMKQNMIDAGQPDRRKIRENEEAYEKELPGKKPNQKEQYSTRADGGEVNRKEVYCTGADRNEDNQKEKCCIGTGRNEANQKERYYTAAEKKVLYSIETDRNEPEWKEACHTETDRGEVNRKERYCKEVEKKESYSMEADRDEPEWKEACCTETDREEVNRKERHCTGADKKESYSMEADRNEPDCIEMCCTGADRKEICCEKLNQTEMYCKKLNLKLNSKLNPKSNPKALYYEADREETNPKALYYEAEPYCETMDWKVNSQKTYGMGAGGKESGQNERYCEERFQKEQCEERQFQQNPVQEKESENRKGKFRKEGKEKYDKQLTQGTEIQKKEKLRKRAAEKLKKMLLKKIYTDKARYREEDTVFEADTEEELEIQNPTVCLMPETECLQNQFVYQGADRTRDFSCIGRKMILGSDREESDIYIPIPIVSRIHARIDIDEQGTFLEDMNSTNGTHVNGELLQYHERRMLQKGDIISLAGESYSFH